MPDDTKKVTIEVDDETYAAIQAEQREGESMSDTIRRMLNEANEPNTDDGENA